MNPVEPPALPAFVFGLSDDRRSYAVLVCDDAIKSDLRALLKALAKFQWRDVNGCDRHEPLAGIFPLDEDAAYIAIVRFSDGGPEYHGRKHTLRLEAGLLSRGDLQRLGDEAVAATIVSLLRDDAKPVSGTRFRCHPDFPIPPWLPPDELLKNTTQGKLIGHKPRRLTPIGRSHVIYVSPEESRNDFTHSSSSTQAQRTIPPTSTPTTISRSKRPRHVTRELAYASLLVVAAVVAAVFAFMWSQANAVLAEREASIKRLGEELNLWQDRTGARNSQEAWEHMEDLTREKNAIAADAQRKIRDLKEQLRFSEGEAHVFQRVQKDRDYANEVIGRALGILQEGHDEIERRRTETNHE